MEASWIWWGIAAYFVVASATAYLSRRGHEPTMVGYFLGGRDMGGLVSALSYSATTYSAFMLIGLAGLTYTGGVGAVGFELLYLCGVTLVLIFGPRFPSDGGCGVEGFQNAHRVSVRLGDRTWGARGLSASGVWLSLNLDLGQEDPQVPHRAEPLGWDRGQPFDDDGGRAVARRGRQDLVTGGARGSEGVADQVGDVQTGHGCHEGERLSSGAGGM